MAQIDSEKFLRQMNEQQAFDLLREVVSKSKSGRDYKEPLAKLKAIMPDAPEVAAVIKAWCEKRIREDS